MVDKTTSGVPSKQDNFVLEKNISNKFNAMINDTLLEQKRILLIRKSELETWGIEQQKEFKNIFGISDEKARAWILTGVNDMLKLNEKLRSENFRPVNENVHASVNKTQIDNFIIDIGKKFKGDKMTGKDSRVSTFCHEMSHYGFILNSEDMTPNNQDPEKTSPAQFQKNANELVSTGSQKVMQNAYNIERYFEIK